MNENLRASSERGSAFLLALIIIVLLTILGVSIVLVTETENALGHTEKTVERQFFATETGLALEVTGLMFAKCHHERLAVPIEPDSGVNLADKQFAYVVQTTKPLTVASACPAWTDCGEDLPAEDRFLSHFFIIGSTAQRVVYAASDAYDPSDPTSFESPFRADSTEDANIRFNVKPGVEVIGQSSISTGILNGPLRGELRPLNENWDCTIAEANSGHKLGPAPSAGP